MLAAVREPLMSLGLAIRQVVGFFESKFEPTLEAATLDRWEMRLRRKCSQRLRRP